MAAVQVDPEWWCQQGSNRLVFLLPLLLLYSAAAALSDSLTTVASRKSGHSFCCWSGWCWGSVRKCRTACFCTLRSMEAAAAPLPPFRG